MLNFSLFQLTKLRQQSKGQILLEFLKNILLSEQLWKTIHFFLKSIIGDAVKH